MGCGRRACRLAGLLACLAGTALLARAADDGPRPLFPGLSPAQLEYLVREAGIQPPLEALGRLASLNSLRASDGFSEAMNVVEREARAAGLPGLKRHEYPSDGRRFYGGFRSEPGWRVKQARLCVFADGGPPDAAERCRVAVDYAQDPLGLAWYSRSADLDAALVDVGSGERAEDFDGRDVRGKVVLARGSHRLTHRLAVYERGAAGVLSSWGLYPDEFPDVHSSDGYGIRPWEEDGRPAGFLFAITPRQGNVIAEALRRGEALRARARVETEVYDSRYEVLEATLPGDEGQPQLLLTTHLDSTAPGACHNAAPALLLVELGRLLQGLDALGSAGECRAGIRLVWVPEHRGTQAWLEAQPGLASRTIGAINLDLLSDRQGSSGSTLQLRSTPDSRPSYVGDVLADVLERSARLNTESFALYPERFAFPLLASGGSRDSWRVSVGAYEGASDHVELLAHGIPAVSLGSWRYPHLGTSGDTEAMFDPTQFRRLAFAVAAAVHSIARGPESQRRETAAVVEQRVRSRLTSLATEAALHVGRATREEFVEQVSSARRRLEAARRRESETLRSAFWWSRADRGAIERLGATVADAARSVEDAVALGARRLGIAPPSTPTGPAPSPIVFRKAGFSGPVTEEYLRHRLAAGVDAGLALLKRDPAAAFEALNFVDGRRTLGEIAERVDVECGAAPEGEYAAWFELLSRAEVVELRALPK